MTGSREEARPSSISVVVPTHNERDELLLTIESLRIGSGVEVVIADGGSDDGTLSMAHELADVVVSAPKGRSVQLNAGAAAARGSILLFLHADTQLGPGWIEALLETMSDSNVVGGAFKISIGPTSKRVFGILTWGTNFRAKVFRLPYGDQGIFVRRSVFEELDGFRSLSIMEDVDFVKRMRRLGHLRLIDPPVATSSRRWDDHGVVRTTLGNLCALTMFQLGLPHWRIRKFYDRLLP